ncbi:MAG: hypothetical protein GF330_05580 [Candidatus Eisenbacteria bacterium]|nr:hypothetical protein [Candidatus Eisenbacteria bacterium]
MLRRLVPFAVPLLLALWPARGVTFEVAPDGSGDYPTIQEAIRAASHGDLILLHDGVFRGAGNRDLDYQGRAITVRSLSDDPRVCILECEGTPAEPHRGVRFVFGEGFGTVLQGVTIRGGHVRLADQPWGGAILIRGASPQIRNCRFESNQAERGGALALRDGAAPEIRDCWFAGNLARAGGGLSAEGQSLPQLHGCSFWRNAATGGGAALDLSYATCEVVGSSFAENIGFDSPAVGVWGGAGLLLERSIVALTRDGPGVLCEDGTAFLACCDVFGNAQGDWIACIAEQIDLRGNIALDPLFCRVEMGDLQLDCLSPCRPGSPPNPECESLIGAWGVGCGGSPLAPRSWGEIKAAFRPAGP